MSPTVTFILLALAFVLPVVGALGLRIVVRRLTAFQLYSAASLIFGVAIASVLLLAQGEITSLQIGNLSLLLPLTAPEDTLELPPLTVVPGPAVEEPDSTPAASPAEGEQTAAVPAVETGLPTATLPPATVPATAAAPTELPPTETPTEVPPTPVPPTEVPPTPAPAPRRTYTVQPGDTLRGIAEQFNVSVEALIAANDLTPQQADSLRIGQELVIP